ncbi:MAG: hypothetical protein H7066_08950, partial [Cytophagaceae bacterium]|nr:hypothetical protein [Gemmatimonadaceae bacterium]
MSLLLRRLTPVLVLAAVVLGPPRAHAQDLTAAARDSVIRSVMDALDRDYVFPERAAEMRKAIVARQGSGTYDAIVRNPEFAVA